jgi:hypothetical protein
MVAEPGAVDPFHNPAPLAADTLSHKATAKMQRFSLRGFMGSEYKTV